MRRAGLAAVALAAGIGAGCGHPAPRRLVMGEDACAHCQMLTADPRYTAQLVTRTGKVYVFDDPGCLAAFLDQGTVAEDRVHSLWVADYLEPDSILPVDRAIFLRSDSLRSPMSYAIAATTPGPRADSLARALDALRLDWPAVRRQARPPAH